MTTRTRSRGGCIACKKKHMKCDENRPSCTNCTSKDAECPGYSKPLIWKVTRKRAPKAANTTSSPRLRQSNSVLGEKSTLATQNPANGQGSDVQAARDIHSSDSVGSADDIVRFLASLESSVPRLSHDPRLGSSDDHGFATADTQSDAATHDASLPSTVEMENFPLDHLEEDYPNVDSAQFDWPESVKRSCVNAVNFSLDDRDDATWLASGELARTMGSTDGEVCQHPGMLTNEHDAFGQNAMMIPCQTSFEPPFLDLEHIDSTDWILSASPHRDLQLHSEASNDLTMHYFDSVCRILSCFDSHESPFRSDIPRVMLTCDYVRDCVVGLSAAHLANTRAGMKAIAMKHQARAMAGLSTVLQTIQIYNQQGSITGPPRFLCSPGARYQALLTALLLGVSSAWYDASAVSLAHLFGARSLFRAWLVDESLCSVNDEPVLLNRQQSFLVGAFVFLECLASFIHDQTFDALAHIRRFGALAEGQTMYPNPWTGISTPLFVHLAETAVIMRYKRSFAGFQPQARAEAYNEAYKSAERLYKKTLLHTGAGREAMEETKDPTTPLDHLIAMDDAYRLVILMELVQVFPELILDEFKSSSAAKTQALVQETVVDFAIAILTVVSHLPQNSGANVMLPLPLIIAGSALQAPRPFEKRPAGTSASCAARTSISAVMHSPRMLQKWREQTTFRLDRTYKHVGLAPLQFAEQLVQEVWRRADLVDSNGSETAVAAVHWMDTMIEERLETLFG